MYRGEETVPLLSQLAPGRLDAVWGSRRLSVRDIEESYRFRYSASALGGAISYLGSHALSLACLTLYGRYITDTLSGVRAIRAADVLDPRVDLGAQEREPRAPVAAAAAEGGDPRDSRAIRPARPPSASSARAPSKASARWRRWCRRFIGGRAAAPARAVPVRVHRGRASPQMTSRLLIVPAAGLGTRLGVTARSCWCRSAACR